MASLLDSQSPQDKAIFSRRAFIIGAAQGGVLLVLAGRLGWLQIVEGPKYQTLSEKNQIDVKVLAPVRGQIYDRHGVLLAGNKPNYRALMIAEKAEDPAVTLQRLQAIVGMSDEDMSKALDVISRMPSYMPVDVADQLSWEDLAKIEVSLLKLPGVSIDVGHMRFYPLDQASAHVIGYVGPVSEDEYKQDRIYRLPGFKVGRTGVESSLDKKLHGELGYAQMEVNATGRPVRELEREEPQAGADTVLSLDAALQSYVQERLKGEISASAVIMDAQSGAIYAMVSQPSFDPNSFISGLSTAEWNDLLNGLGKPLINKAVSGQYPPASTFKMVTALAALEAGVVDAKTRYYCNGHYDYGSQRFHCWKASGHGSVDVIKALEQSCDVYFYELATELGIDRLAAMARRLGLGVEYDLDVPSVRSGLVPDKDWKMGHHGQVWKPGDTIVSTIGQGALLATPLQLAVMTARLVNGGYGVEPYLVEAQNGRARMPREPRYLDLNPHHLKLVLRGMDATVNDKRGTAHGSRIMDAAWTMGGKTGTAQVKSISAAQRAAGVQNEDLPWKQRHHALFVGYAPVAKPRYVCSVVVEHGVGGSRTAAPIARDLMLKVQQLAPAKRSAVLDANS